MSINQIVVREYAKYSLAHCPYHQDSSPSMLVYKSGYFVCLACGERGRIAKLEAKLRGGGGVSFSRSTQPSHNPLAGDEDWVATLYAAHEILLRRPELGVDIQQRGVWDRVIPNKLGWFNGWITIPLLNKYQIPTGYVLRATSALQRQTGTRFSQPVGQEPRMFAPAPLQGMDYVFIVFGIFDALTLAALGYNVVTGTGGKDQFRPEWLQHFRAPIILVPDLGEERSMGRYMSAFGWRAIVAHLNYPEGAKDPNDFLKLGKKDLLSEQLNQILKEI